jgi:hypothetical protein
VGTNIRRVVYKHVLQAVLFLPVNAESVNVEFEGIRNGKRSSVPTDMSNTEVIFLLDEWLSLNLSISHKLQFCFPNIT